MGNQNAAATSYAQTYGGYAAPLAAGYPGYGAPVAPVGAAPLPVLPAGYGYSGAPVVPVAGAPVGAVPVGYPAGGYAGGRKQKKESKFLNKEYAERIQAETALAYGNYAGATWHDARADRWGVKADKTHYRTTGNYAFHPIAPSAGIAAVQPGMVGTQFVQTQGYGAPLFADAVQVGLYGAQAPVSVLPQAGGFGYPAAATYAGF